nr:hypothetical protein [Neobacillus sp. Marseille-Q6967]
MLIKPISEFANEEGFELNKYLSHLFEFVSNQLSNAPSDEPSSKDIEMT